ncbi:hypothetical protein AWM68_13350 [Fictibacillus phosphorivorans]|uniref:Uncharacterized protein n=1 Tax=Fictibacillus phosphorivorans TaxID=1221500 RepID=A0A165MZZ1_9BACL|nr:hypothetical protein [Fictibacillus phosphorivorans]KZE64087.1 hypothetical protein AWM68_13350 [Fictibacillus phosphorivorans]
MGVNLIDHYVFNPFEELELESNTRLVIYDNEEEKFAFIKELAPKEKATVPLTSLQEHLNYKYKYQVKSENKWIDYGKYKKLLPESKTDKGIKYLFYKSEGSDQLVVVFQAINQNPSYNYIKTLKDLPINKLFIKDDYGDDAATRSSYYLGKNKSFDISEATQELITSFVNNLQIKKENVIFAGSSKGGFASLYHGYKFGCGHILSGGPQILLGDYLGHQSEKSIRPPILKYLAGENTPESKEWANKLMVENLKNAKKPYPQTVIHIGVGEPHYEEHVVPFLDMAKKLQINNVSLDAQEYNTHEELAIYFPKFFRTKMEQLVKKIEIAR